MFVKLTIALWAFFLPLPAQTPTPQAAPAAPAAGHAYLPWVTVSTNLMAVLRKGIVLNGGAFHCEDAATVGAVWQQTGGPLVGVDCPGVEDVPRVDLNDIGGPVGVDSPFLLTVNEPDLWSAVDQVVTWQRQIETAYPDKLLVAPDMSGEAGDFIDRVRAAYITRYGAAPRWAALAAHCYNQLSICQPIFQRYITLAQQWGITGGVWVTEYAMLQFPTLTRDQAQADARAVLAWLNAQPGIARYAWFNSRTDGGEAWSFKPAELNVPLFTYTLGSLTAWGDMYSQLLP